MGAAEIKETVIKVYIELGSPKRLRALIGFLCLVGSAALSAQTVTPAASGSTPQVLKSKLVTLASDACPVVHGLDWITFDWNPGFDYESLVTGLRTFTLTFSPLRDGVNVNDHQRFILGSGPVSNRVTPGVNGFFHIEIPVPRTLPTGTYRVVDAESTPLLPPEYRHLKLEMTNSPVDSRFCITVVSTQPQTQQQSDSGVQ